MIAFESPLSTQQVSGFLLLMLFFFPISLSGLLHNRQKLSRQKFDINKKGTRRLY
jgi:hypothetical protein